MPLSGEAIRTMNYVDDISVTLRRILAVLPSLTVEERQRVSEHIKKAEPSYESVITCCREPQVTQPAVPEPVSPARASSDPLFLIRTVAVIGAGTAGRSFALACAAAGFDVILEDVMPARLRQAEADFADLTQSRTSGNLGSLQLASTVEQAVREADLAIDFVPDELESKLEIFSMIDRMAPPKTILCTPSEALSITDLASCVYRPERCIALRGSLTASNGSSSHPPLRLLHPTSAAPAILSAATSLFTTLGFAVHQEPDPDVPMLMKNQPTPSLN